MKNNVLKIGLLLALVPAALLLDGCQGMRADTKEEAPPAAKIVPGFDVSVFSVEHPEQFPVATATAQATAPELVVTGTVNPDISRNVPVISLASGRVVSIQARLGDTVSKGQLLLTVRSDDISGAFGNYRKAVADEVLARTQLERAKDLHLHGAIALNDLPLDGPVHPGTLHIGHGWVAFCCPVMGSAMAEAATEAESKAAQVAALEWMRDWGCTFAMLDVRP